jgi:regulatory protein
VARRREHPAAARARKAAIDDPNVVLEAALRFLEARQRSTDEVRRRLTMAGYRTELVDGAIERLIGLGILDDETFAKTWLESRDRAHPRGERALKFELRQKGIEATVIAETLRERRDAATRWAGDHAEPDAVPAPTPDESAARKLLLRHARALERVTDPRARRQKAYALLARNGFGPEIAGALAREADRAIEADDEVNEPPMT